MNASTEHEKPSVDPRPVESKGPAEILEKVYGMRVWIEVDCFGGRHVVAQSEVPSFLPFRFASFFYNPMYTDNATVQAAALQVAESLTTARPIEERFLSAPLISDSTSQ